MRCFERMSLALAIVFLAAGGAMGSLEVVGDPIEGGSWSQGFVESGVGPFDFMAVKMFSADDYFEEPVFSAFTHSSWTDLITGTDLTMGAAEGATLRA